LQDHLFRVLRGLLAQVLNARPDAMEQVRPGAKQLLKRVVVLCQGLGVVLAGTELCVEELGLGLQLGQVFPDVFVLQPDWVQLGQILMR
jgi:hypothetical protein